MVFVWFKIVTYITALLGHSLGQFQFRRIRQGGILGLALMVALLIVNLSITTGVNIY